MCHGHKEVAQAIADMVTQSAGPYVAAAMGMALAAYETKDMSPDQAVPFLERAGFCGMADPLPAEGRECTIEPFELWGVLEDGTYRLGYEVTGSDGVQTLVQGEFQFHVDLQICGYPLAED